MTFGSNFLTTSGWTLTQAEIVDGSLVLQAGGKAVLTKTKIGKVNVLPEGLKVTIVADTFPAVYAPTAFFAVHIVYIDGNTYDATVPIINNAPNDASNICVAILIPSISSYTDFDISIFESITFTIYSSAAITLTTWECAKSESDVIKTDTDYFGIEINTDEGFKVSREDGTSEAIFNSEKFVMRALIDGIMRDRIYFDPATGDYVFAGTLSADIINAISALITPSIYSDQANIGSVTVDELLTRKAIKKYLRNDTSDDKYQHVYDQWHDFIVASAVSTNYGAILSSAGTWDMVIDQEADTYYADVGVGESSGVLSYSNGVAYESAYAAALDGRVYRAKDDTSYYEIKDAGNDGFVYYNVYNVTSFTSTQEEQATDRLGRPLYWIDDTYSAATITETEFPVYTYVYAARSKLRLGFRADPSGSGFQIPIIELGAGSGISDYGKGFIYKGVDGLYIEYLHSTSGQAFTLKFTDNGIDFSGIPSLIYNTETVLVGLIQLWVQSTIPTGAKK